MEFVKLSCAITFVPILQSKVYIGTNNNKVIKQVQFPNERDMCLSGNNFQAEAEPRIPDVEGKPCTVTAKREVYLPNHPALDAIWK